MKLDELFKAPTIASATMANGEINRKTADRMVDPHGYFKPKRISEATIDLNLVTSNRENNEYEFEFPITEGGYIRITARVYLTIIYIVNIKIYNADDNPDKFTPKLKSYNHGVRLGTSRTRKLLNYVVSRVKQDYPKINKISGDRITGARAKIDAPTAMVSI